MKHTTIIAAAAALLVGLSSCSESKAPESTANTTTTAPAAAPAAANTPPMDSAARMKAWMDYMTPGETHRMMATSDGKWKTESTMWMEPGQPPVQGTGTAVNKMILGGRYQRMTYTGSMMGQPFEGESITGYDNARKVYVNTWIDNMGTGVMMMEGPWDEASKTITMKGECTDPITGKPCTMREVMKIVDDTHQEMEMWMTQDGKEMKTMEMKMTKM